MRFLLRTITTVQCLGLIASALTAKGGMKSLPGHVPPIVNQLTPIGDLDGATPMRLSIGLTLGDSNGLDDFLAQLYNPASTNYHRYLTPEQFTERFGPSAADYAAVMAFAASNHLTVTHQHGNRLVLDVTGVAADVARALAIHLRIYHHPTEARDFFAPDTEPSVDASLPVADITGLSSYSSPHPRLHKDNRVVPRSGSASDGGYMGGDFRAAYLPGVTLTGAGQTVGLLEFDGFYQSDINSYESQASLPTVPVQTILLQGYNGAPGDGNDEVSLDIEMAISMAPGLTKVVSFEGNPSPDAFNPTSVLNTMASSNQIKEFSSSWGWSGGPNTTLDNIFKEMQSQGQTFFDAAGDSDAFTVGSSSVNGVDNPELENTPSSSPYITQVGATTLTTSGPLGSWVSEKVWNWGELPDGEYAGSSGGVSSYYSIPSWQSGVSMSGNGGSTAYRNIPDVALTGDNVYVVYSNGMSGVFGGTSCAAPLWASLTALLNEQRLLNNETNIGFINPAIYALGQSSNYGAVFHDITAGNDTWAASPDNYYAVAGYDLCSGWGTPLGTGLIAALAVPPPPPPVLKLTPTNGFISSGPYGGPFSIASQTYTLSNSSSSTMSWSLVNSAKWLSASPVGGSFGPGASVSVNVSLTSQAASLPVGGYATQLFFTNTSIGGYVQIPCSLTITNPLVALNTNGFASSGPAGGPFSITNQTVTLSNVSAANISWTATSSANWMTVPGSGSLPPFSAVNLPVSLTAQAAGLGLGAYSNVLTFSAPAAGSSLAIYFYLTVVNPYTSIVQNGGFETGSFANWTLVGDTTSAGTTYDAVEPGSWPDADVAYQGNYGAALGDDKVATLSQTLPTAAGQVYLLSFWLENLAAGSASAPEIFNVNWNSIQIAALTNPPAFAWTNFQYLLTATGSSTVLQFAVENLPSYFGLDSISATLAPTPGFQGLAAPAGTISLTWQTAPGLSYQVQYTSNLTQKTWVNLGSPVVASGTTLTVSDTISTSTPQRFYRLILSP